MKDFLEKSEIESVLPHSIHVQQQEKVNSCESLCERAVFIDFAQSARFLFVVTKVSHFSYEFYANLVNFLMHVNSVVFREYVLLIAVADCFSLEILKIFYPFLQADMSIQVVLKEIDAAL